ncbi:hypothetical protein DGG96_19385 [Legionella qingyii]|uniref:RiboL-PSP-HEPN domain-containing protein n=1 Tax=Legionella qingyii TaxID=2184757 RepID=A0A317TYP8_9GAMM|nr:hypothetical protein [Legionella qingyii]PWY54005.1 hypothetical protein DGG96_19385 [Legionella qingyii]RUR18967.1 hypothetical protein ELY20_16125 [Legionella qingyii]RUR21730.1 hypothetical protein ELY16_15765 [Legionella qingyii]
MNQFKFLKIINFEYQLQTYELIKSSIQKDISHLELKKNNQQLTRTETDTLEFYKQSLKILIESTFLQIYSQLEEALYHECSNQLIKKNASISRFEMALKALGYTIDSDYWNALLNISKIRNCLLHGNGRLDSDRYGIDTKETISALNSDANTALIEQTNLKNHEEGVFRIKLNEQFLHYCFVKIKNFINSQK